jgi:trimethylamine:corrinoid methyltransferase-like protein
LLHGVEVQTETLATALFKGIDFKGDFLKQQLTRQLFPKEQYLPSAVIDRGSIRTWQTSGSLDTFARAKKRTAELLAAYRRPAMPEEQEQALKKMVVQLGKEAGMDEMPLSESG